MEAAYSGGRRAATMVATSVAEYDAENAQDPRAHDELRRVGVGVFALRWRLALRRRRGRCPRAAAASTGGSDGSLRRAARAGRRARRRGDPRPQRRRPVASRAAPRALRCHRARLSRLRGGRTRAALRAGDYGGGGAKPPRARRQGLMSILAAASTLFDRQARAAARRRN